MKKLILIMFGVCLLLFAGCSKIGVSFVDSTSLANATGEIISINSFAQVETSIARNELGYDAWGRPKVIKDYTLFHGLWTYDIPKTMWIVKENGVENLGTPTLASSYNGMLKVDNGGEVISRRNPRYQPNRGWLYSTAVILENHTQDGVREFGAFTDENGFFFRLENGSLYAVDRRTENGVTTEVEEIIDVPVGINLSLGNIYDIQAQWRGVGNIKFFINLELVYEFEFLGTLDGLSISNPALPLAFKTSAGSNPILAGCVDLSSEGGIKENRQYNSLTSEELSLTATETAVLTIRVNETYNGFINTRDLALRRISAYADDNTVIRIYYSRDNNVITGGTWVNNNGGNVQYQITPTFNNTIYTKELVSGRITAFDTYEIDNPDEMVGDFYLVAGDYIVITLEAKANTNGGATIEWGEEI